MCVELQELEEVEQEAAYVDLVLGELLTGGGGEVALMLCHMVQNVNVECVFIYLVLKFH